MSFEDEKKLTKDNLDFYLKELAKEFRKINGTGMPAELILVGGAAVLANYGFRDMTTDIDAVIHASSSMHDAIVHVGDRYNLPYGWLNTDFMRTNSYSSKIDEVSEYYHTYSNILEIRTINAEYLIAMKLRSGRKYKRDLSDIVGILAEHEKSNKPITLDMIDLAVKKMYGGWDDFQPDSKSFIQNIVNMGNYESIYNEIRNSENEVKDILVDFDKKYAGVMKEENIDGILSKLKDQKRKQR